MTRTVFIGLFVFAFGKTGFSQYPQWGNLQPGPYHVGFKSVVQYDHSRYSQAKVDFEGREVEGETAHPIQISMWYPARSNVTAKKMIYEEYFYSFKTKTETERNTIYELYKRSSLQGLDLQLSDAEIQTALQTPSAVAKDAKPYKGSFPIILCAQQSGPTQCSLLYEYLASKGYVVIASTVNVRQTRVMWSHYRKLAYQITVNDRIRDLEYLLEFARELAFTDKRRVGLFGINSEGVSTLLFQMKNLQADALVSIDGWETSDESSNEALNSVYFDINKLRVPYFLTFSDREYLLPLQPASQRIFDTLQYATRYQYTLRQLNHIFLMNNLGVLPNVTSDKHAAYEFLNTSIGNFFDAYLKKSDDALAFLKKSASENGFPASLAKSEIKKSALPPIPTGDELAKLFENEQFDKIASVLMEAKKLNPNLNTWGSTLNSQGYSLLRRKKYAEAIKIFRLNTEMYPGNVGWFDSLSEAYERSSDLPSMKLISELVLAILKEKAALSVGEKSLKESAERRMKM